MSNKKFIEDIAKYVIKYAPKYDIKVHSPIIAQAILESASGTSELAVNANNFFGLKYRQRRCPTCTGIYYKVGSEQNADGSYTSSTMKWCKFDNMENGVIGYFDFINIKNYENLKNVEDPKTYLENIKKDGYATSLKYVDNLMMVIERYDLTKYDKNEEVKEEEKYYRCQCGAFKVKANALKRVNELRSKGIQAILKQSDDKYLVQVGVYKNVANAEKKAKSLRDLGYSVYIKYC